MNKKTVFILACLTICNIFFASAQSTNPMTDYKIKKMTPYKIEIT